MPKAEWGVKHTCPQCKKRFYDLNRDPATCPECGIEVAISSLYQSDLRQSIQAPKNSHATDKEDLLVEEEDGFINPEDELLEDDEDTASLDDIADVPAPEDDNL